LDSKSTIQPATRSLVEFKVLSSNDLEAFRAIQSEYLDQWSMDFLKEQFTKFPNLYVGVFVRSKKLVGIAYGSVNEDDSITLQGIAVKYSLWRKGIGSRLLSFFEEQVRKTGRHRISLGSGEGFAEQFYLKNGYTPLEIKAKSEDGRVLATERIRDYSDGVIRREHLRQELKPKEVIFIMEKHW